MNFLCRIHFIIATLTIVLILNCSNAWAQACNPHCYIRTAGNPSWLNATVTYRINDNMQIPGLGQQVWETEIVTAHQTWNNAGSYFFFVRGQNTSNNYTETGNDGQNVYGWVIDGLLPAGRSRVRYSSSNGLFIEIDAFFNQSSMYQWSTNPSSGQIDIQSVAVHELGHWLGLADESSQVSGITCPVSLTCPGNVMWGTLSTGITRRVLSQDDKFGAQSIYPVSRSNTTLNTNRTVFEKWSGNITATNNLHITCGVTVEMVSGTLTIPFGSRLYIDNHATLKLNSGVICNTFGAEIVITNPCGRLVNNAGCNVGGVSGCIAVGGIYELGDGLTQQFQDDGILALDGGTIVLGSGSSIVSDNSGNSRMLVRQNSSFSFGTGSSIAVNGLVNVFDNIVLIVLYLS